MAAVAVHGGKIRPIVAAFKALASSIALVLVESRTGRFHSSDLLLDDSLNVKDLNIFLSLIVGVIAALALEYITNKNKKFII